MAKLLHNVTVELFLHEGEPMEAAERAIDTLAPVPMAQVRETQWRWHPGRRKRRVYELAKRGLRVEESETEGDEGRMLLRLSRKGLEEGKIRMMRREEFVMVRLNLAAYPKNRESCRELARRVVEGEA